MSELDAVLERAGPFVDSLLLHFSLKDLTRLQLTSRGIYTTLGKHLPTFKGYKTFPVPVKKDGYTKQWKRRAALAGVWLATHCPQVRFDPRYLDLEELADGILSFRAASTAHALIPRFRHLSVISAQVTHRINSLETIKKIVADSPNVDLVELYSTERTKTELWTVMIQDMAKLHSTYCEPPKQEVWMWVSEAVSTRKLDRVLRNYYPNILTKNLFIYIELQSLRVRVLDAFYRSGGVISQSLHYLSEPNCQSRGSLAQEQIDDFFHNELGILQRFALVDEDGTESAVTEDGAWEDKRHIRIRNFGGAIFIREFVAKLRKSEFVGALELIETKEEGRFDYAKMKALLVHRNVNSPNRSLEEENITLYAPESTLCKRDAEILPKLTGIQELNFDFEPTDAEALIEEVLAGLRTPELIEISFKSVSFRHEDYPRGKAELEHMDHREFRPATPGEEEGTAAVWKHFPKLTLLHHYL